MPYEEDKFTDEQTDLETECAAIQDEIIDLQLELEEKMKKLKNQVPVIGTKGNY